MSARASPRSSSIVSRSACDSRPIPPSPTPSRPAAPSRSTGRSAMMIWRSNRPTTLTSTRACRRRRSSIQASPRCMRCCTRRLPTTSISSPTAMAATASRTRSTTTIATSRICAGSAASAKSSNAVYPALCYKPGVVPGFGRVPRVTVSSMTGFARADGHEDGASWVWELKSVNSKSLDLRFRLPPGLEALELPLRTSLAQRLKRGALSATLTVTRGATAAGVRINREALAQVVAASQELVAEGRAALPRADGLLALRGVLEGGDEPENEAQRERRQAALLASWEKALDGLVEMRRGEGARLIPVLEARLAEIARLAAAAEDSATVQPEALKTRLRELVAALLDASPALPPERLAQEAALLVAKADIREEIDRLAAQELLAEGGAIGRRFDFLCQEFNREANTLCSKSADVALTRIGLDLKAVIEQLREQVQNLE